MFSLSSSQLNFFSGNARLMATTRMADSPIEMQLPASSGALASVFRIVMPPSSAYATTSQDMIPQQVPITAAAQQGQAVLHATGAEAQQACRWKDPS